MKVINLFGCAGAGKSTCALGVAHYLKINYLKVEYVSEYAKQLVMSESSHLLKYQDHVFTNQLFQMEILRNKDLDYIVTDSPLLLSSFYGNKYGTSTAELNQLVNMHFNNFENINYFINRTHKYDPTGRVQTEEESNADSELLLEFLQQNKVDFKRVNSHNLLSSYIAYEIING